MSGRHVGCLLQLFLVAALLLFSDQTRAAPGDLDTAYGTDGSARAKGSGTDVTDVRLRSAMLPDGSLVAAYRCWIDLDTLAICVEKLTAGGTPDAAFGVNGYVQIVRAPAGFASLDEVFVDAQRIEVLAQCVDMIPGAPGELPGEEHRLCIVRLNAFSGQRDTSFGSNGIQAIAGLETPVTSVAAARGFDGRIYLSFGHRGYAGNEINRLARLNYDATLDTSYVNGASGVITFDLSSAFGGSGPTLFSRAIVARPDGSVNVIGLCQPSSGTARICVAQVAANGALIASSGSGGIIPALPNLMTDATTLALQADGKLLAGGRCDNGSSVLRHCVARFNTDLSVDTSFGLNGVFFNVEALPSSAQSPSSLLSLIGPGLHVSSDGRIALATMCRANPPAFHPRLCLYRVHLDGQPYDRSFADGVAVYEEIGGQIAPPPASIYVPIRLHADRVAEPVAARSKYLSVGFCGKATCNDARCVFVAGQNNVCAVRIEAGPFDRRACSADVDGDGFHGTLQDQLLFARTALGFSGNSVVNAATFAPGATRNTWPAVRDFLANQCRLNTSP
jgi:uncharacterized delta-60 repeat protein